MTSSLDRSDLVSLAWMARPYSLRVLGALFGCGFFVAESNNLRFDSIWRIIYFELWKSLAAL